MVRDFPAGSAEERGHAELLMEYQNKRGGRVSLKSILIPEMEFNHAEKVSQSLGPWAICIGGKRQEVEADGRYNVNAQSIALGSYTCTRLI